MNMDRKLPCGCDASVIRHLSLFSGIGGFDLAASLLGYTNIAACDIDTFCRKVLYKNFSDIIIHKDIRENIYYENVTIITAGLPCQPFSRAGHRRGTADARYLWHEMFGVVKSVRPKVIIIENVPDFARMALDEVLDDLEGIGYATEALVLPACAIGAPHRRDRLWVIAYPHGIGCEGCDEEVQASFAGGYAAQLPAVAELSKRWEGNNIPAPGISRAYDGVPGRMDRIRVLGNSVVVPLVCEIFLVIEKCIFTRCQHH